MHLDPGLSNAQLIKSKTTYKTQFMNILLFVIYKND